MMSIPRKTLLVAVIQLITVTDSAKVIGFAESATVTQLHKQCLVALALQSALQSLPQVPNCTSSVLWLWLYNQLCKVCHRYPTAQAVSCVALALALQSALQLLPQCALPHNSRLSPVSLFYAGHDVSAQLSHGNHVRCSATGHVLRW